MTLGKYPMLRISEDRRRAQMHKGEVASGSDPVERQKGERAAKRAAATDAARMAAEHAGRMTVAQLAEAFLIEKSGLRWGNRYRQLLTFNVLEPTPSALGA